MVWWYGFKPYAPATFLRAGAAATVSVVLLSRDVPAAGA
ncbi:Hypothetical protein RY69_168 [Bifidobacterium breve]|nr:Hypothetical protein RY69_168 [Bifidobacterium breve]